MQPHTKKFQLVEKLGPLSESAVHLLSDVDRCKLITMSRGNDREVVFLCQLVYAWLCCPVARPTVFQLRTSCTYVCFRLIMFLIFDATGILSWAKIITRSQAVARIADRTASQDSSNYNDRVIRPSIL